MMIAVLRRAFGTAASIDIDRAAFDAAAGSDAAAVSADTRFRRFTIAVLGPEPDDSPDAGGNSCNPAADPAKNHSIIWVLHKIPNAGRLQAKLRGKGAHCLRTVCCYEAGYDGFWL